MKTCIFHFAIFFGLILSPLAVVHASSSPPDSVHFCLPFDYEQWRRDHPLPAAKRPADLNVGEPRTVRMIYFLPNDRPYRAKVVQDMKDRIREVQTFYSVSMQAREHGDRTFRLETDAAGEPTVHQVDGQHADSHYLDNTFEKVLDETEQTFDLKRNIYLVVIDISTDVIDRAAGGKAFQNGKTGGFALVTSDEMDPWNYHNVVSHELGHTFGLQHDFRAQAYVMSYGNLPESQISACNAGFLAAHTYFNPNIPTEAGSLPTIELVSPLTYPEDTESVAVRLEASDSDGLHQVILFTEDRGTEVKSCRGLAGEREATVTIDYNGVIPSQHNWGIFSSLSDPRVHPVAVMVADAAGNTNHTEFTLSAIESESTLPRPQALEIISGDNQRGTPGSALSQPLVVEVRDQHGNPLPDATVVFTVTTGDGKLSGRFTLENVTTDANGRAELLLTLGPGLGTNAVKVSIEEHSETFHAVSHGQSVTPPSMDGASLTWQLPYGAVARLGTGRLSQTERAVVFSPDGQLLAVAKKTGVWVYDISTSKPLALFPAEKAINSLAFSSDGKTIAFSEFIFNFHGGENINVQLWDVATGTQTAAIAQEDWSKAVAFSTDGTLLATANIDETVTLWNVATQRKVATHQGKLTSTGADYPLPMSFSPDDAILAFGSKHGTVNLLDVSTGTQTASLEGHTYPVTSISFSPNGATLASGSWDRTVRLWNVATRENIATLKGHTDRVNSVTFLRGGTTLASGSDDGTIKLWDVTTNRNTTTFEGHTDGIGSVAFSSQSNTLVAGVIDGSIKLWDVASRGVINDLDKGGSFTSVAYSGDGTILALGSDRTIRLWDVATGTEVAVLEGHTEKISSLTFLRDGKTLASGSHGEVYLWDVAARLKIDFLSRPGCRIAHLTASPNGKTIASGGINEIVLWDLETGAQTAIAYPTKTVSFSPDSKTLVSTGFDRLIQFWDVDTQENIATLDPDPADPTMGQLGSQMLFSPDGTLLASALNYGPRLSVSIKLWEVSTKAVIATFEEIGAGQIHSAALSSDGRLFAVGTNNGAILLVDTVKRESVTTLRQPSSVVSLSFSPDGRVLASGSEDGTVLLWDVAPYLAPSIPNPDFNSDGTVDIADFLLFAGAFGLSRGDAGYDARFDLDSDGTIGFSDFLIFGEAFGKKVPSN